MSRRTTSAEKEEEEGSRVKWKRRIVERRGQSWCFLLVLETGVATPGAASRSFLRALHSLPLFLPLLLSTLASRPSCCPYFSPYTFPSRSRVSLSLSLSLSLSFSDIETTRVSIPFLLFCSHEKHIVRRNARPRGGISYERRTRARQTRLHRYNGAACFCFSCTSHDFQLMHSRATVLSVIYIICVQTLLLPYQGHRKNFIHFIATKSIKSNRKWRSSARKRKAEPTPQDHQFLSWSRERQKTIEKKTFAG